MNLDDKTLDEILKMAKQANEEINEICSKFLNRPKQAEALPIKRNSSPVKYTKINATIDGVNYGAEVLS